MRRPPWRPAPSRARPGSPRSTRPWRPERHRPTGAGPARVRPRVLPPPSREVHLMSTPTDGDPLRRLDDPDYPALSMSQAAELLGVQAAFLRSLDAAGVLSPHRSTGGHRRYSRAQLGLAARLR